MELLNLFTVATEKDDVMFRGRRIKHVRRRQLRLPRATFADVIQTKESFCSSALPQEEKQKMLETVPSEEIVNDSTVQSGIY